MAHLNTSSKRRLHHCKQVRHRRREGLQAFIFRQSWATDTAVEDFVGFVGKGRLNQSIEEVDYRVGRLGSASDSVAGCVLASSS